MIIEIKHKGTEVKITDDGVSERDTTTKSTIIQWKDQNSEVIRLIQSVIETIDTNQ